MSDELLEDNERVIISAAANLLVKVSGMRVFDEVTDPPPLTGPEARSYLLHAGQVAERAHQSARLIGEFLTSLDRFRQRFPRPDAPGPVVDLVQPHLDAAATDE